MKRSKFSEAQIKEIAEILVRYGCCRIHVLLRREGWAINQKRVYWTCPGLVPLL